MTTTINKKQKNPNVPNLRFPEFSGEWMHSTIGSEFDLYSGNTPNRLNKEQFKGDVNWISSGELKEHYISETKEKITQEAANNNNLKLLPIGTFVIAIYGLEAEGVRGTCSITRGLSTISQACMAFTPIGSITNEFLYSWYKKHGNLIGIKYAQGTKQQNLSYDIISQFRIDYPQREEQVKLERFISLLDERIATQNKIIEKLQSLIKGLVVAHYSTNPHTIYTKIRDLGEAYSTMAMSKDQLTDKGNPCIFYGELFTIYGCCVGEVKSRTHIKKDLSTLSSGRDLLFPASTTVNALSLIAPSAVMEKDIILGGDMFGIKISQEYNPLYLSYYFNYIANKRLSKYAKGTTIIHLHYNEIANVTVELPSIEEQNKIVTAIQGYSARLVIEETLLQSTSNLKQYLLSQMFI